MSNSATTMRKLQQLVQGFLSREIGLEELQRRFSLLLVEDRELAAQAAVWLDSGEKDGLLSSTVCTSMKNVLITYLASVADRPDLRNSGIFEKASLNERSSAGEPAAAARATVIRENGLQQGSRDPVKPQDPTQIGSSGQRGSVDTILRIGSTLSNQFVLVSLLGSGGMGSVYKARDLLREAAQDRNPYVALKVLSEDFKAHPDSIIALQRESRRAQALAHPNVITVHEFRRDGPHVYISMEYLDGRTLDAAIKSDFAGGLPMSDAWPIVEGIGLALEYGHKKGIVHSDIKPGNVFVCKDGTVKVLDFGISRPMQLAGATISDQTLFDPGKRLGGLTPAYAALEMWAQATPDPRDDIYALSCVTYLLLTGQHPFDGKAATEAAQQKLTPPRIASLSRGQWNTLAKGFAFKRENRLPSVSQFLAQMAPSSVVRSRRRITLVGLAVAGLIAAGIGVRIYGTAIEGRVLVNLGTDGNSVPAERPELTDEQKEEIARWVQLAELDLANLTVASSAEELSYYLSDSPNSIRQLVESIREYDPGHEQAQALQKRIVSLYSAKARQLVEQKDFAAAMQLVTRGSDVEPGNQSLYRLRQTICANDASVC